MSTNNQKEKLEPGLLGDDTAAEDKTTAAPVSNYTLVVPDMNQYTHNSRSLEGSQKSGMRTQLSKQKAAKRRRMNQQK